MLISVEKKKTETVANAEIFMTLCIFKKTIAPTTRTPIGQTKITNSSDTILT